MNWRLEATYKFEREDGEVVLEERVYRKPDGDKVLKHDLVGIEDRVLEIHELRRHVVDVKRKMTKELMDRLIQS